MMEPGAPMDDAPVRVNGHDPVDCWLLDHTGNRFQAIVYADDVARVDSVALARLRDSAIGVEPIIVTPGNAAVPGIKTLHDTKGRFAQRYDAQDGTVYLVRPDQHVAARWRAFDGKRVQAAVKRATCTAGNA